MTSKLTREWLQQTISDIQTRRDNGSISWDSERENCLQAFKIALSVLDGGSKHQISETDVDDSEPVAWRWRSGPDRRWYLASRGDLAGEVEPLYRHAQPVSEREQVRREHAEWSQVTFGNVGPIGPLKHLAKEAMEAAAESDDLSEWADMQFLLWDAQRRAGITDEQITQAMIEKLAVNKQREWPEPKDGEPRLHIKDQPSAVGPVTDAMAYAFHHALTDGPLGDDDVEDIKIGLRAAFANVTTYQPLPVVLKEHQIRELVNKLRDIAIEYHSTQQLREHIACVVRAAMIAVAQTAPKSEVN